jgi:hypothetical protein
MELPSVQDCGTLNVLNGRDSLIHVRECEESFLDFSALRKKPTFANEFLFPFGVSCFHYLDNGSSVATGLLDK